jgi:hypothetical protein
VRRLPPPAIEEWIMNDKLRTFVSRLPVLVAMAALLSLPAVADNGNSSQRQWHQGIHSRSRTPSIRTSSIFFASGCSMKCGWNPIAVTT